MRTLRDMGVKAFTTLDYAHRPGMAQWLNDYSTAFAATHVDAIHSATFYPEPGVENVVADSLIQGARIFRTPVRRWSSTAAAVRTPGNTPDLDPSANSSRGTPSLVLIIAHAGLPEYRRYAGLAANHPHVYLDTAVVGTSCMEQVAPITPGYLDTLAGLSHKVVLGTDFPSISLPLQPPDSSTRKLGTRKPMDAKCPLAHPAETPGAGPAALATPSSVGALPVDDLVCVLEGPGHQRNAPDHRLWQAKGRTAVKAALPLLPRARGPRPGVSPT